MYLIYKAEYEQVFKFIFLYQSVSEGFYSEYFDTLAWYYVWLKSFSYLVMFMMDSYFSMFHIFQTCLELKFNRI